ncbi:hypothetical protein FB451DRAFT_1182975 [Mycena latifolia]|nr:hypothetical protein FB451DRAFT_1182975 [Mycena latifolia]
MLASFLLALILVLRGSRCVLCEHLLPSFWPSPDGSALSASSSPVLSVATDNQVSSSSTSQYYAAAGSKYAAIPRGAHQSLALPEKIGVDDRETPRKKQEKQRKASVFDETAGSAEWLAGKGTEAVAAEGGHRHGIDRGGKSKRGWGMGTRRSRPQEERKTSGPRILRTEIRSPRCGTGFRAQHI